MRINVPFESEQLERLAKLAEMGSRLALIDKNDEDERIINEFKNSIADGKRYKGVTNYG
jgi:hypothetical protein